MLGWDTFFLAQIGAAGALAGLVFVGVTLNHNAIMCSAHLPNRAQEALMVLLANLIVSALLLVPSQNDFTRGLEVLGVGLVVWIFVSYLHADNFDLVDPAYRLNAARYALLGQLATAAFPLGGFLLASQWAWAGYAIAWGCLLSYVAAMANAWILTVEISR